MFCIEDLVPKDHLLRKIERAIDWGFIYELVEDKYCLDNGRPSINPVTLIKIPIIQYLYGIKSMRQTIKKIEVNVAYRWFLGLDLTDKVPHFSTFGKNYVRRFKDTDIFDCLIEEYDLQALAFRCWNELQLKYGIAPCVLMGMLNERGIAAACESDITNAVMMRAMSLAADWPVVLLDVNNNFDSDMNKGIFFHHQKAERISLFNGKAQLIVGAKATVTVVCNGLEASL